MSHRQILCMCVYIFVSQLMLNGVSLSYSHNLNFSLYSMEVTGIWRASAQRDHSITAICRPLGSKVIYAISLCSLHAVQQLSFVICH